MNSITPISTNVGKSCCFLALLLTLAIILALNTFTHAYAETPADVVHITNTNILTIDWTQTGKYYVLDEDITLTAEWKPIDILGIAGAPRISITFDGQGHSINNFYVLSGSKVDFAGLFGHINRSDVIITNVGVNVAARGINAAGSETTCVGGLVGFCDEYSTVNIQNCYVTGNVSAAATHVSTAGGLVGNISGSVTIMNCYARSNVSASTSLSTAIAGAGGLIGANDVSRSTITNCYATGDVYASAVNGYTYAGGLIGIDGYGSINPTVINSYRLSTQSIRTGAGVKSTINLLGDTLTSEKMQTNLSFTDWDFSIVWGYKDGVNDNYPVLRVFYSDVTPPAINDITVIGVTVNPQMATVTKGETYPFSATVTGFGNPPQDVIWFVEGSTVSTITSGGALTVSVNETAEELTIRATSAFDGTQSGIAVVSVTQDASTFIPLTDITGVPSTAIAGTPLNLTGVLTPSNATNQTIIWSIKSANDTGATITGNTFIASAAGMATITAMVANGSAISDNFTKDFNITVNPVITQTCALTIYAETGGRIALGTNGQYRSGETVNISASAYSDYVFEKWVSTNGGTFENEYNTATTFTMPSNATTVTAIFTYRGNTDWRTASYIDAYISPSNTSFDKNGGRDVSVRLSQGSYVLRGLKFGNYTLVRNKDYSMSDNNFIITAAFLSTLAVGDQIITFDMSGGINPKLNITIRDTTQTTRPPASIPAPTFAPNFMLIPTPTPMPVNDYKSIPAQPANTTEAQADYPVLMVELNGRRIDFDGQPPILKYNNSFIPVREMFEMLGYSVEWNQELRTATIKKGKTILIITEGSYYYTIHGLTYKHHPYAPAQMINGCLMVPFADVLKSIGCSAYRDESNIIHMFLSM